MAREKLFTVTIKDCEVQTFRAGGKGGQNQNKRDTGVRIIHHASGARGESREGRTQLENKKLAFRRMGESIAFRTWVNRVALNLRPIEEVVEEQMHEDNLLIEYY
jgi:protein subunit release factor B